MLGVAIAGGLPAALATADQLIDGGFGTDMAE